MTVWSRVAAWLAAAITLAGIAAAMVSLALFALAVGLVVMVVAAGAMVSLAERRLTITRSVAEREVREDQPLWLRFTVHGMGLIPVRLEALSGEGVWTPLDEHDGTLELIVGRPGAHYLEPSRLRLSDALGIFRKTVLVGERLPVLILPVPDVGVHVPFPPSAQAEDLDLDGLRPYLPGSPISRIHWASLARGGELHERRLAAPPTGLPLVVVNTVGADDPAEVDWVARAAAGCVLRLTRAGGCKVLLPGDKAATEVTDLGAWHAVHRRLAVLDTSSVSSVPRPVADAGQTSVVSFPAGMTVEPPLPLPSGVVPMPVSPEEPR